MSSASAPAPTARRTGWPVILLAAPAFVAIWSGWVGLGQLTGFGVVHPLPGTPLADWSIDTAITLPIGVETYAAYALHVWLSGHHLPVAARRFAKWYAIGSLILGAAGQVAYHFMVAAGSSARTGSSRPPWRAYRSPSSGWAPPSRTWSALPQRPNQPVAPAQAVSANTTTETPNNRAASHEPPRALSTARYPAYSVRKANSTATRTLPAMSLRLR